MEAVREISWPLLREAEVFKSLDHVVRVFDSALFALQDLGLLNEAAVECLLDHLGMRFAPFVVLMHEHREEIVGQKARFRLAVAYLDVVSRYAEKYRRMGVRAPRLPLGFGRPPPPMLPPDPVEPRHGRARVSEPQSAYVYGAPPRVEGRAWRLPRVPPGLVSGLRWLAVLMVLASIFAPWFRLVVGDYLTFSVGPLTADVELNVPGFQAGFAGFHGNASLWKTLLLLVAGLFAGGFAAHSGGRVSAGFASLVLFAAAYIAYGEFRSIASGFVGLLRAAFGRRVPPIRSPWGSFELKTFYGLVEVSWGLTAGFYLALGAAVLLLVTLLPRG